MNKWRWILVGIITGVSSLGIKNIAPKEVEGLQVILGVAAFICLWIAIHLAIKKISSRKFPAGKNR